MCVGYVGRWRGRGTGTGWGDTSWDSGWRLANAVRFKDQLAYSMWLAAMIGSGLACSLSKANEIGFWDSYWNLCVCWGWLSPWFPSLRIKPCKRVQGQSVQRICPEIRARHSV